MRKLQESRMTESLTNAFITRSPIQLKQLNDQTAEMIKTADENIKVEQNHIQTTTDDIAKIDQQVNEMRFASASKKDIRTFQFVADQFGTSLDKVAKWFIFTIIFVFDPLAIALILAYNVATHKKPEEPKSELTNAEFVENSPLVNSPSPINPPGLKEEPPVNSIISSVTSPITPTTIVGPPLYPRPTWLQ